jgi:hypothetical protein
MDEVFDVFAICENKSKWKCSALNGSFTKCRLFMKKTKLKINTRLRSFAVPMV